MRIQILVMAAALLLASELAEAQDRGWIVELTVGYAGFVDDATKHNVLVGGSVRRRITLTSRRSPVRLGTPSETVPSSPVNPRPRRNPAYESSAASSSRCPLSLSAAANGSADDSTCGVGRPPISTSCHPTRPSASSSADTIHRPSSKRWTV